jgi:signal transduction histidine kinase
MTAGTRARLRSAWRSRLGTLRARVTVVASLAITAGVVGGLLLMYLVQMNAVRRTIDGQLRTYATQIAQTVQSNPAGAWPNPLPPSSLDPNAQAQVIAPDGRVLAATRTLAGLPAVYTLPDGSDTPVRQKAADGVIPTEVRVVAVRTTVAGGQPVTIITGTPSGLLREVNEEFIHQLLIGVPIILALAAATVWLVVGRALRPVERIRHAVTDITSADLTRRVPEPQASDEIGNLARTMNHMLSRLDDSAARQRRFVADASHELRSPLAAIRTTLEVGLAHPHRAPWPTIAERAAQQAQRLEDLIQQLLLLAKADERQLASQRQPVDLGALLGEIRTTTTVSASAQRVRIHHHATRNVITVGDPNHLQRLFRNIVDNAVRHAHSTVTISAAPTTGTVRIEVDDDGPGIPAEDRERVFDRFVRLDHSRERGTGTAGLGLAIAREIVLAHHGHIAITESPAGGTRVSITLPLAAPDDESVR